MVVSIKNALQSNVQLFLIEYRAEDSYVPIKKIHKMTEKQSIKEMEAAGFRLKENIDNLPWQHCMIFEKNNKVYNVKITYQIPPPCFNRKTVS